MARPDGPGSREPSPAVSALTGFDPSRFKPSVVFLRKVEAGLVRRVRGYSKRRGGYDNFVGGERQWEKHYLAGYVTRAPIPDLGRPGVVQLTERGRIAIATEARRAETGTGSVHEGAGRQASPNLPDRGASGDAEPPRSTPLDGASL